MMATKYQLDGWYARVALNPQDESWGDRWRAVAWEMYGINPPSWLTEEQFDKVDSEFTRRESDRIDMVENPGALK